MNQDDNIRLEVNLAPDETVQARQAQQQSEVGGESSEAESQQDATAVDEAPTLAEVIRDQVKEGEVPRSSSLSLAKILGGDILTSRTIRQQIWLLVLIAAFMIVYIANRYSVQKDLIEIDKLQTELKDAKYRALSSTSKLTEKSRESNLLKMLKDNADSTLKIPSQPPYIIQVPEEEQN